MLSEKRKALVSTLDSIKEPPHDGDAGYDLIATSEPKIVGIRNPKGSGWKSIDYIEYSTSLKIQPPEGFFSIVVPRSSISKKKLMLANSIGVIDAGYRGEISARFKYIFQPSDLVICPETLTMSVYPDCLYEKGDKIAQLIFIPLTTPKLEINELDSSTRNEGGYGSTGL